MRELVDLLKDNYPLIDWENEKNLLETGGLDSITIESIICLLEDAYDIEIDLEYIQPKYFESAETIYNMIEKIKKDSGVSETKKTVVQRLLENSLINPDDDAIIADEKETTYQEIADMIISVSKWLTDQGVIEGDCVCVQAIHEDTCIACYYAIHLIGAILVPVEKTAPQSRIKEIAAETKCKLIIGLDEAPDSYWHSYDEIRLISHRYHYQSDIGINYPSIDLPCEMVFTTGTTGKSKGVLMTHRHMSWYAYSVAKSIEMQKKNRLLITTPLNHAGGLRRTHLSLANGCCVVYMDGMTNLRQYFDYIKKYNVTSLYLPPVAVGLLLRRAKKELSECNHQIDFVYSSSSQLSERDCEGMRRMLPNTRLYNAYEASETPGVSMYNYNTDAALKNCIGKSNDGVEVAILSNDGAITQSPNIQGQICVRSLMNMKEYYGEPALTESVRINDWFVSNDLGYTDEDNNLYYCGRKGDVIEIGGYKIAPTDVEEAAMLSGMINECICIRAMNSINMPYLKLLVVVEDESKFDSIKLAEFLKERLEEYKIPKAIDTVDKIERTFNGKLNRKSYRFDSNLSDTPQQATAP